MEVALLQLFTRMHRGPFTTIGCLICLARGSRMLSQLVLRRLSLNIDFSSSACTCAGSDHPGPSNNKGRGAPEIDLLEAEHNKQGSGGVVSQSMQVAPFAHDYIYLNDTPGEWTVYNPTISWANNYRYAFHLQVTMCH